MHVVIVVLLPRVIATVPRDHEATDDDTAFWPPRVARGKPEMATLPTTERAVVARQLG
jgi:hypothetical protein